MTRVSVALCTYNGERFLEEQLASIEAQTSRPHELVAFDDASTDASREILDAFARRAAFDVKVVTQSRNVGVVANFEAAMRACTGDVIALADQDDVWRPRKLEHAAAVLDARPDVSLVFSDADVIGPTGEPLGYRLWQSIGFDGAQQRLFRDGQGHRVLERRNVVTGASCVFREGLRTLALPLSPLWVHDAWIACVALASSKLEPLPEVDLAYRRHATQQVGVRAPASRRLLEYLGDRLRNGVLDRAADLRRSIAKVDALLERFDSTLPQPDQNPTVRAFRARREHLAARLELPDAMSARVVAIAKELSNRRYGRFSSGATSALKDLVSGLVMGSDGRETQQQ